MAFTRNVIFGVPVPGGTMARATASFLTEKCGLEQGGVVVEDVAVLMGEDAMTPWTSQQRRAWVVDNLFW
jgi:hypothetical protein